MSGYCYCGRPATTTSGSCGHADCDGTMTAQVNRALSANPVPPAPPGRLTREQRKTLLHLLVQHRNTLQMLQVPGSVQFASEAYEQQAVDALTAALAAEGETPPAPQDGIRHDAESGTYVARHTILTAGTTYAEAAMALASAVHLTAKHWPKSPAPVAGEGDPNG